MGFRGFYVLTSALEFLDEDEQENIHDIVVGCFLNLLLHRMKVKSWCCLAAEGLLGSRTSYARLFSNECREFWKKVFSAFAFSGR